MVIRITCIKKLNGDHHNPYEAIAALGWISDKHPITVITSRQDMCDFVDKGVQAYVQSEDGDVSFLITEKSPGGNRYVRTTPDDNPSDNLLTLPECP